MDIIKFENVSYIYPDSDKFALDDICLNVEKGSFFAVMGENGAGKTAFCKLINGVIPHLLNGGKLTGFVTVCGIKTNESSVPELSCKAGMVMDDPDVQIFTSTVFHEAAFGPENICLPADEIKQRVGYALSSVGLNGFEDRAPSTLSGGEKQRLSIAAALSMKTEILVLDEPLCRLDPEGAQDVMSVLNDLKENQNLTIVMASHNSEMMLKYADKICVLKNGKIVALDTPKNIFADNALLEHAGIQPVNLITKFITTEFTELHGEKKELWTESSYNSVFANLRFAEVSSVVDIKNFSFKYPNGICIENINLTINENDFIALIGSNGCGKTTLLKNITGLLRPSSGEIFVNGKDTKKLKICDISKEIGFVMQNPDTQLFTDSVFNEVAFALKNARLSKSEIKQRVEDALSTVGINDSEAFPHTLSRCERTKIIIACVLAMGCKILIFDEVNAGNDYNENINIMNIAQELHKKGFTIIYVTHNMSLAYNYAHRLIRMERRGIVFDGYRAE